MHQLSSTPSIRTTHGTIARFNLNAQIDGLERHAAHGRLTTSASADLTDLLILRAQIVGDIADYERAAALAEQGVHDNPDNATALMARARARTALHHFDAALTDIESAERLGLTGDEPRADKAAIFQTVGRYDEALALRRAALEERADFETYGGLASLYADLGELPAAEDLFDKCQSVFRGVSPFPIAQLEFLRGHMWHEHHDLPRARHWLTSAWLRLPSYAQAEGHLAEVEFAMGERQEATTRLRGLASLSKDPDYAAQLARRLGDAGHHEDAAVWRDRAAAGFDKLIASHPAAFADHAAEFWLTVGGDPERAHSLAELNLHNRRTPQAHALLERTVHACSQRPS